MPDQQHPGTNLVRKVLDISIAHLPEATAQRLAGGEFPMSYSMYHNYGGLVSVPEKDEININKIPCEALCTILRWAVALECDWVMFDQVGIAVDGLPLFEW